MEALNVTDDWNQHWNKCSKHDEQYHASDGGCYLCQEEDDIKQGHNCDECGSADIEIKEDDKLFFFSCCCGSSSEYELFLSDLEYQW